MEDNIYELESVQAKDAEGQMYDATFNGRPYFSINAKSKYWPSVQAHLDAKKHVDKYEPHVDTPAEKMVVLDHKMIAMSARILEDQAKANIDAGVPINQEIKDLIAEREVVRGQL